MIFLSLVRNLFRSLLTGPDGYLTPDQHASDEKYNFETLQATTRIRSQILIQYVFKHYFISLHLTIPYHRPKPLQLPSSDEITAMENLDILAKNGFGVSVDEDAPYGKGERIRLTSMPVSHETVFDVKGLLSLLSDFRKRC